VHISVRLFFSPPAVVVSHALLPLCLGACAVLFLERMTRRTRDLKRETILRTTLWMSHDQARLNQADEVMMLACETSCEYAASLQGWFLAVGPATTHRKIEQFQQRNETFIAAVHQTRSS
jgi:hypothetical protein